MGGGNFSGVPEIGQYTYSQRSIPYLENPDAYHTGIFNRDTYFDKIDAIRDGDLTQLNRILDGEGIEGLSDFEFNDYVDKYRNYIQKTEQTLGGKSTDYVYGVQGKAAPWGDMTGGAEQLVTPFSGLDMIDLGIIK